MTELLVMLAAMALALTPYLIAELIELITKIKK
jgi:hypothetical protein